MIFHNLSINVTDYARPFLFAKEFHSTSSAALAPMEPSAIAIRLIHSMAYLCWEHIENEFNVSISFTHVFHSYKIGEKNFPDGHVCWTCGGMVNIGEPK